MSSRRRQFEDLHLPEGESLVWQGRPSARALLVRVFHLRLVIGYFALLFIGRLAYGAFAQQAWTENLAIASRLWIPLVLVLALLGGLAVLYSRTTRYSVTSRRVLVQFGAVLPMTLNIPFTKIVQAAVKRYGDGTGDLPLAVTSERRLAFLLLWPHVRPWRLTKVEPMLRCVPQADEVATLLAKALQAAPPAPEPVVSVMPAVRATGLSPAVATAA